MERKKRLQAFMEEVEKGEQSEAEALGLSKEEYAFFEVVKKHLAAQEESLSMAIREGRAEYPQVEYVPQDHIELAKEIARDVAEIVRENYVIDWVSNPSKTDAIPACHLSDVKSAILQTD